MTDFTHITIDSNIRKDLQGALAHRFPQAVLLSGPDGSGKTALARYIAAALLCVGEGDVPCGQCLSCRKIESNTHPDFLLYDLSDPELQKVDAARRIRSEAHVLPNDGERKVFLITKAHKMSQIAQNALLKVLEEPPGFCFFILLSSNPSALLETIRSRCTQYHLRPVQNQPDDTFADLLAPYLTALSKREELDMLRAAVSWEKLSRPETKLLLELLQTALRDAVLAADIGCLIPSLAKETEALSRQFTKRRLIALYDFTTTVLARVDLNASSAALSCALSAEAFEIIRN